MDFIHLSGDAGNENHKRGDNGGQKAVAETSKEGAEGSNEAGQETRSDEAVEQAEKVGEDAEDGVEERDKLGTEADDGDGVVDGQEELRDELIDELEDLVDLGLVDGDAGLLGETGDDLGEVELDAGDLVEEGGLGLLLVHLVTLDLGDGGVWKKSISVSTDA